MTGLPEQQLRASAMNALGHGADSLYTPFANPVSRMTALRGAGLIGAALDQDRGDRDRAGLALGSILCGYAIDSALFAIHHVICQTLVRGLREHRMPETNAAILPPAMACMRERAPQQIGSLAVALGTDPASLAGPDRRARARRPGLAELPAPTRAGARGGPGRDRGALRAAVHAPSRPSREQLREIIEAAW